MEDHAFLCRVAEIAITVDDLKRLALIAGFKNRTLAEKCLGEAPKPNSFFMIF